ncbi:MAG: hypothetical protein H6510_05565 [Acidobacteria bacterium]|nr:hypothetical protein [Acidobacteriota bacterium]MCB9397262.1 hypothetical protein [Acidobacteriota bacterium]
MAQSFLFLVNPASAGGKTRNRWRRLQSLLQRNGIHPEVIWSERPGHLIDMTAEALEQGQTRIVAVGGDGTFHEVVNGWFKAKTRSDSAALGLIGSGTGGDYLRTLGLNGQWNRQIEGLIRGRIQSVDVLSLEFLNGAGQPSHCYGLNVAAFGLAGSVDRCAMQSGPLIRLLGGKAVYFWASLKCLFSYQNPVVRLNADDFEYEGPLFNAALCKGRFFGGGIPIAPPADPQSGKMRLTLFPDWHRGYVLRHIPALYRGQFEKLGGSDVETQHLSAYSDESVWIDVDGESKGTLPLKVTCLPGQLRLCY